MPPDALLSLVLNAHLPVIRSVLQRHIRLLEGATIPQGAPIDGVAQELTALRQEIAWLENVLTITHHAQGDDHAH